MQRISQRITLGLAAVLIVGGLAGTVPAVALSRGTTMQDANEQAKLQRIITRGDAEIARRLRKVDSLTKKINASQKLSSSSKAALLASVSSVKTSLTGLKTKLDAETTVDAAKADAQAIILDYRVYSLIVPKVDLIKVADDQLATAAKLGVLVPKLQSSIQAVKADGKDVSKLQQKLDNLNSHLSTARTTASSIESSIIHLQVAEYDKDHGALSDSRDRLKTSQADLKIALTDARSIVTGLKRL